MYKDTFIETSKITSKGQANYPQVCERSYRVAPGDKVSFIVRNGTVQIVSAVFLP